MYTTARNIFGWSDEEFWRASPKRYFAILYKYSEMQSQLFEQPQQEVLVGKNALSALSSLASKVR